MTTKATTACRACGSTRLVAFHEQASIPTNSCLLLDTLEAAASYPRGDLSLSFCDECGFIQNDRFDVALSEYSDRYEETQAFSARFVDFGTSLAREWVDTYDLRGKTVLEIGCGKGEFLQWMVEAGVGRGIGIDPGTHPERINEAVADRLEWRIERYSEAHADLSPDAIVCRHTLEHIAEVEDFMKLVRRSIGHRLDTIVLFELPDVRRVLYEVGFWDVYYEHCSYFSAGSLARLFERTGFQVEDVSLAYDDQYLLLVARPVAGQPVPTPSRLTDDMDDLRTGVEYFRTGYAEILDRWTKRLQAVRDRGGASVVWGSGSKGVSFLTSLPGSSELVRAAVDINPFKTGKFMAGSGHPIIEPTALAEIRPELVVVMNPIYTDEIGAQLATLGVTAEMVAV